MVLGKDVMHRYGLLLQKEVVYRILLFTFQFLIFIYVSLRALASFTIRAWIPRSLYRSLRLLTDSGTRSFRALSNAGVSATSTLVSCCWFQSRPMKFINNCFPHQALEGWVRLCWNRSISIAAELAISICPVSWTKSLKRSTTRWRKRLVKKHIVSKCCQIIRA